MISRHAATSVRARLTATGANEPAVEIDPAEQEGTILWRGENLGDDLRQSLSHEIEIRTRVAHRGVQAGVTKPLLIVAKGTPPRRLSCDEDEMNQAF